MSMQVARNQRRSVEHHGCFWCSHCRSSAKDPFVVWVHVLTYHGQALIPSASPVTFRPDITVLADWE